MGIQDVQAQHQRDIERHQIGNMNAQQIEAQRERERVGNMNAQQIEAQHQRDRHRGKTKPITPVRFDLSSTRKKKPRADGSENIEDGEEGSERGRVKRDREREKKKKRERERERERENLLGHT